MHTCCSTHTELITRQAKYLTRKNEARSCNHCCSGKSVSVWICSSRYSACNMLAPYCHPWPTPLHKIFPHYLPKTRVSIKKIYRTQNVCFDFLYNSLSEILFILRRSARDMMKNIYWSSCPILIKHEFSR